MGGVHLMDGLLDRYHVRIKTKFIISSAWHACLLRHKILDKNKLELPDFCTEVAEFVCLEFLKKKRWEAIFIASIIIKAA